MSIKITLMLYDLPKRIITTHVINEPKSYVLKQSYFSNNSKYSKCSLFLDYLT